MKVKVEILAIVLLTLLCASSWAGPWTIDSFDDSPDPGEPDNYISGESSSGLKPVQPGQVTQQSGRLYVRQKFEDAFGDEEATYQIFQGRPTEAAKSLGKISLEGIPYTTLLKMKLFYSKTASGSDDLETVYYDGKDIFVEGEDPVYINLNGRMEELKPLASKDFKVSITSNPSGANVTVGGADKGQTPVTFNLPSSKTITAVVSKEGYYTVVKPITPVDKQTTQEGVLLTERVPLENPAETYKSKLQAAVTSKDANEIKNIKASIQKILNNYTAESRKSIDAVMSKFPANPPKAATETSTDYSARQSLWTNTQAKERDALNKEAQSNFMELKDLLIDVDAAIGDMEFALKYEYIPSSAISITNLGVKDFSLNAEISNSRVDIRYERAKLAYGSVPRNEITEDQESVHGVLKIWNVPNEKGKFASIYDIAFFYNETPLKILTKGVYTTLEATSSSRNTEKDLNSRVARYSGKAAWDKKDEEATLNALRGGEVPDGASRKAAPAPVVRDEEDSAYYSEEEDEEEFEQEMDDQEDYDYARYGATSSAKDVFGNTDEYLFWSGMLFAAAAIGTGVMGFLQFQKYDEAKTAYNMAVDRETEIKDQIRKACDKQIENGNECDAEFFIKESYKEPSSDDPILADHRLYKLKTEAIDPNQKAMDSRKINFISWWGGAAVSAAISIILFAW
ncbi:MAG: PEGA domain-containing protein [Candidatus Fibromonas sp.]|nr:PEGA domain-containing protein [Candidatus Fibromonas sp.]